MRNKLVPVLLVGGAALCVAALALWVAYHYKFGRKAPAPPAPKVANVAVETVRALPQLPDTVKLPAVIEPDRTVTVSAEVAGRVEKLLVEEGAACRAGQLLVELNAELLKADRDGARARARLAGLAFLRTEKLHAAGAARGEELEAARAARDQSAAALAAAEARLRRARVLAPVSGALDDLAVEKGEYVSPGAPLARIVDSAKVKALVAVPERDAQYVKAGDRAEVLADIRGKPRVFAGKITYIGELAERRTRTTRVEVTVDNPEGLLRSGRIVTVLLTRRTLKDVILVPLAAVVPLESGHAVHVAEASRSVRVVALCAGLSLQEAEKSVAGPIREALAGLKGLGEVKTSAAEIKLKLDVRLRPAEPLPEGDEELLSSALRDHPAARAAAKGAAGSVTVIMLEAEFAAGTDLAAALEEVRAAVERARPGLPSGAGVAAVEAGWTAAQRPVRLDTSTIRDRGGVQCVRVLEGLKPGEKLIVAGGGFVAEGQPVRVREARRAPAGK